MLTSMVFCVQKQQESRYNSSVGLCFQSLFDFPFTEFKHKK